jgi:hypothetical protein
LIPQAVIPRAGELHSGHEQGGQEGDHSDEAGAAEADDCRLYNGIHSGKRYTNAEVPGL